MSKHKQQVTGPSIKENDPTVFPLMVCLISAASLAFSVYSFVSAKDLNMTCDRTADGTIVSVYKENKKPGKLDTFSAEFTVNGIKYRTTGDTKWMTSGHSAIAVHYNSNSPSKSYAGEAAPMNPVKKSGIAGILGLIIGFILFKAEPKQKN